ncbi:hypothetical protein EGW08_021100, partial [Elysia chlorotica]
VEVVDDVGVLVFSHDKDLVDDEFFLGLLGQIHRLDSDLSARGHLYSNVHGIFYIHPPLANFFHLRVFSVWVPDGNDGPQLLHYLLVGHLGLLGFLRLVVWSRLGRFFILYRLCILK